MKSIRTRLLLLLLGFTVPLIAQDTPPVPPAFERGSETTGDVAEEDPFDPDESAPKTIQVQLEYIELPHEALTKLLFLAQPKTSDAAPLRKKLQEMVERNEAKVLETQLVVSKSSSKSTSESIHEFIYPTEFEPPSLPCAPTAKDSPPPSFLNGSFPANPAIPTAFDTRNLGSNLEVEPTAGTGGLVDIRLAPQLVWHTGDTTWQETKDSMGNTSKVRMPDIYTLGFNISVTCISGQYTLVAVQSPMNDKGETDMSRKVVVLLKCDVLSVR